MATLDRDLTGAEVALLGLLTEQPAHPWQLQREVTYRDMRSWAELSQAVIYKQLRALEDAGLVSSTTAIVDGRARRTYSITDEGRGALAEGILTLLSTPEFPTWRVDVATYNVSEVGREEALTALETYEQAIAERIEGLKRLDAFLVSIDCPVHRRAVARRSIRMLEGELAWLAEFREQLGSEE